MATTSEATTKRESVKIRTKLDSPARRFEYTKDSKDTYTQLFKYMSNDVKLAEFSRDEIAMVSDCYLLYAIAVLGVADLEAVRLFLSALSNRNKDLLIADMGDPSNVRRRLKKMFYNGMLFKHSYKSANAPKEGEADSDDGAESNYITLYTVTNSTQSLMNKRLGRRVVLNEWLQALPLHEMMGWAACAYVSGMLARNPAYIEQVQGIYTTKAIGTVFIPGIMKMKSSHEPGMAYVGIMPAFIHFDSAVKTEAWFEEDCHYLVKRMKQFLYSQDAKHRLARLIIVVEDNADLVQVSKKMIGDGALDDDDYNRIFFTGEGVIRQAKTVKFTKCFLRIRLDKSEQGYSYEPAAPDFIL
jgi:hypothetical protein